MIYPDVLQSNVFDNLWDSTILKLGNTFFFSEKKKHLKHFKNIIKNIAEWYILH